MKRPIDCPRAGPPTDERSSFVPQNMGRLWSIDRVDVLTRTSRALEDGGALGSDRHAPGLLHPVVGGRPTVRLLDDTVSLGPVRRARGPGSAVRQTVSRPGAWPAPRGSRRGQGAGRCAQARGATRGVGPRRGRRRLSLHDLFSLPVPVDLFALAVAAGAITTATEWAKPESMLPWGVLRVRRQANQSSVWSFWLSSWFTGAARLRPGSVTGSGFGSVVTWCRTLRSSARRSSAPGRGTIGGSPRPRRVERASVPRIRCGRPGCCRSWCRSCRAPLSGR